MMGSMQSRGRGALGAILGLSLAGFVAAAPAASDATLPRDTRVPGGLAVLDLGPGEASPGAVYFGQYRAPVVRTADGWKAIVGIPLATEPGRQSVKLVTPAIDDADRELAFEVAPKAYATQKLTVEPRKADPLPEDLKRIDAENERTERALATYSETLTPSWSWAAPVPGVRSDSYGKRRVFNGLPRKPHSGMDIAAPTGTRHSQPGCRSGPRDGRFFLQRGYGVRRPRAGRGDALLPLEPHRCETWRRRAGRRRAGPRRRDGPRDGTAPALGREHQPCDGRPGAAAGEVKEGVRG